MYRSIFLNIVVSTSVNALREIQSQMREELGESLPSALRNGQIQIQK